MLVYPFWRRAGLVPALLLALLVFAPASGATTRTGTGSGTGFQRDQTPLSAKLTDSGKGKGQAAASHDPVTSGATIRMLVGLAIVLLLIYGLYRLLKRTAGKEEKTARGGDWMSVIASTPLAPSRSIHLIRVGEEVVLVGSGEQGVTPIRVYSAEEARQLRIEPREPLALALDAGPSGDARPGFLAALIDSLKRMTAR